MKAASEVKELFGRAVEQPLDKRRDFVSRESAGDSDLAGECDALIEAYERSGEFLENDASALLRARDGRASDATNTMSSHWAPAATTAAQVSPVSAPVIADYELIRQIGRGGVGEVWLARSVLGRQFCAVKIVRASSGVELDGVRQYKARIQEHPHVYPIEHIGEVAGGFYYVMPLAENAGGTMLVMDPSLYEPMTLKAYLSRKGRLRAAETIDIGIAMADALAHLHERGAIHGDVKPANVMRYNGAWRLGDHGLMADMREKEAKGWTEGYCPPEGAGTRSADQFALGRMLFVLLTGESVERFKEFRDGVVATPQEPKAESLRRILLKACAPVSAERYASIDEMRSDLEKLRVPAAGSRSSLKPIVMMTALAAAVAILVITGSLIVASLTGPGGGGGGGTGPSAIIKSMDIRHSRGSELLGTIGVLSKDVRVDDDVKVVATLARPAYCYLIALNPDGSETLCWPQDPATPPTKSAAIDFPAKANEDYGLTDGAGIQAFVLVASEDRLPAYDQWREKLGGLKWAAAEPSKEGWRFDGQRIAPLSETRGEQRATNLIPEPFISLTDQLKTLKGGETVTAVAFPVRPK